MTDVTLRAGADPWCRACESDLPARVVMIDGRDVSTWPPAFCSPDCARAWGDATDATRLYEADREEVVIA